MLLMDHPRPLFDFIFGLFQTNVTIFTTNLCENVHPMNGAEF